MKRYSASPWTSANALLDKTLVHCKHALFSLKLTAEVQWRPSWAGAAYLAHTAWSVLLELWKVSMKG